MAVTQRAVRTALPALLVLVAAIAAGNLIHNLRYLETGEEYIPYIPARQDEGEPASVDFGITGDAVRLFLLAVIIGIVAIVVAGLIYSLYKGEKLRDLIPGWEILGILLAGAVLVILLLTWDDILAALNNLLSYPSGNPPPGTPGPGGGVAFSHAFPTGMVIAIAAAALIMLAALVYHVWPAVQHHVSYEEPERDRKRLRTLELVRRGIKDLQEGGDPRLIILRSYATMCGLIERRGLSRGAFLTPREFQGRAREELSLSEGSIRDLTSLFEEARYSTHPVGQKDADTALRRLTAVKDELEAQHGPA